MVSLTGKPDYLEYVVDMENRGWTRKQQVLDENNTRLVTRTSLAVNTTGIVLDIKVPAGQKASIMGQQQVPRGADASSAHSFRIRLAGTNDVEISQYTKLRITKENNMEDLKQLARPFYADVSMSKQEGAAGTRTLKDRSEWFRFPMGVELNGEDHLFVYVVSQTPTGGPNLPDIAIESTHVTFALEIDFWHN